MNIETVARQRAEELGIRTRGTTQLHSLIESIQQQERGQVCYLSDNRYDCSHTGCQWRSHCMTLTATWLR